MLAAKLISLYEAPLTSGHCVASVSWIDSACLAQVGQCSYTASTLAVSAFVDVRVQLIRPPPHGTRSLLPALRPSGCRQGASERRSARFWGWRSVRFWGWRYAPPKAESGRALTDGRLGCSGIGVTSLLYAEYPTFIALCIFGVTFTPPPKA